MYYGKSFKGLGDLLKTPENARNGLNLNVFW